MSTVKEVDDRFKRFGTVSFTGISKINDFIDHLDDGRVTGTRCTRCGPPSYFRFRHAVAPHTSKVTSLNPPISLGDDESVVTFHLLAAA